MEIKLESVPDGHNLIFYAGSYDYSVGSIRLMHVSKKQVTDIIDTLMEMREQIDE